MEVQKDDDKFMDYWYSWFVGFTDGESHFSIRKHNEYNSRAGYKCQFEIKLRNDDRAILEEMREMLGIGKICDKHVPTNSRPQSGWGVYAIQECAQLVDLFDKYPLRAKKKCDFEIWKQAVAELQKPCDERDPDLLEYYFLKIREVRQYEQQDKLAKPKIKSLQLNIEFH